MSQQGTSNIPCFLNSKVAFVSNTLEYGCCHRRKKIKVNLFRQTFKMNSDGMSYPRNTQRLPFVLKILMKAYLRETYLSHSVTSPLLLMKTLWQEGQNDISRFYKVRYENTFTLNHYGTLHMAFYHPLGFSQMQLHLCKLCFNLEIIFKTLLIKEKMCSLKDVVILKSSENESYFHLCINSEHKMHKEIHAVLE